MEVYVNPKDIDMLLELYKKENQTFVVRSFPKSDTKRRCLCYIDGQECTIDFFIKKDGKVRIMPIGKNIPTTNKLLEFIKEKTIDASIDSQTCVITCEDSTIKQLVEYFETECNELVKVIINSNNIKFRGYNGDTVTCTFHEKSSKLVIQAKPLSTFSLIITFLSQIDGIGMNEIVNATNELTNQKISQEVIRDDMKSILKNSYKYLDEALKKSIAGSLILLKRKDYSEDYSGYVTGEFKALEGYLKKILTKHYKYKFDKKTKSFWMFAKDENGLSAIDKDTNLSDSEKDCLNKLYNIYQNKRNVYLHGTIDPAQTKIVQNISEVQSLSNQILATIEESYNVIFL